MIISSNEKIKEIAKKGIFIAVLLLSLLATVLASISFVSASVDLVEPENNTLTNSQNITFSYYAGLDNITGCELIIDSTAVNSTQNVTSHDFNELSAALSLGEHLWSVSCYNESGTETSETYSLIADLSAPIVVLFNPVDGFQLNASAVEFEFVAVDNLDESIMCDLVIDNATYSSVNITNSIPGSAEASLADGTHEWKVVCTDDATNSKISETRIIKVNSTLAPPKFNITLTKKNLVIGEPALIIASAPKGTSVRIEVCPDQPGFVTCDVTLNQQDIQSFPIEVVLPYYYQEGKYVVEAWFNYSNQIETKTLRYNVTNNIVIDIEEPSGVDHLRKNLPIFLEAHASGGVGTLNYTWLLSNGTAVNKKKTNITYSSAGNYTNIVVVKDAYNNTRNASISLIVSNSFNIRIVTKDAQTNELIKDATVKLDEQTEETDALGAAEFYVRGGVREVIVLAENYTILEQDLNITKDETFTLLLNRLNTSFAKPSITIISPINNTPVSGTEVDLVFKLDHYQDVNCSFYINEKEDGFFMNLGNTKINARDNGEKYFRVSELENMTYWWKIECVDTKGKAGLTETMTIKVNEPIKLAADDDFSGNAELFNSRIKEYEQLLNDFGKMSLPAKEALDAFGITKELDDAIIFLRNSLRDVDGLNYKTGLTKEQKAAESAKLLEQAEKIYRSAPVNVELIKSEAYVDYITKEDLELLLEEYLKLSFNSSAVKNINSGRLLEKLNDLQQEMVISTKIKSIKVTFKDGSTKRMTGIIRDIKTYNLTKGAFIVEVVPKTIAQSADEIVSPSDFGVIKEDPIIRFNIAGDSTIVYYVEKDLDVELFRDTKTALFIDPANADDQKITGFSIRSFSFGSTSSVVLIALLALLIGSLLIVGIKYDGIHAARCAIYHVSKNQKLHYINVVLSDIDDNLQMGYLDKAFSLYEEAKSAYSMLPTIAKNDVYDKIIDMAAKIKEYHQKASGAAQSESDSFHEFRERIIVLQQLIISGEYSAAINEYKHIESGYNSLDHESKEMFHPCLVDMGNKLQVIISSNSKQMFER